MSATIQPTGWPNNMSADDRKVWIQDQIVRWVGEKKIDECLSALELGNLSMTEKMVVYRSVLIMGGVRHCRNNPRAEARIPILTLIVYLSDNAKGPVTCRSVRCRNCLCAPVSASLTTFSRWRWTAASALLGSTACPIAIGLVSRQL